MTAPRGGGREVTEWYAEDIKPIRIGWYECKICLPLHRWDGKLWHTDETESEIITQKITWRGLTKEPKK